MIQETWDKKETKADIQSKKDAERYNKRGTHYGERVDQSKCFICGETDHISTKGPNGMRLIQYFSCKKFAEMTPYERFSELRRKGFCIQCLFPGASQSEGKHKNGACQIDFTLQTY